VRRERICTWHGNPGGGEIRVPTSREGSSAPCRHRQHSDFRRGVAPAVGPVRARTFGWRSVPQGDAFFDRPPAPRRSRESRSEMRTVSAHIDEPYEEETLAYRTLLANESFDDLLRELAETARSHTNCEEVAITPAGGSGNTSTGTWSSGAFGGAARDPSQRSSLGMPVLTDGLATHLMSFYKSSEREKFTPAEIAHARRCSDLAGLVLSGAAFVGALQRVGTVDDETGVLVRKGFEDDVQAALVANEGRAGLFITRVADLDQINRRWGREVGDEVLYIVARAMRDAIGESGTVGRLRRHEFGGLLPDVDFARTAEIAAATQGFLTNPLPVLGRADVYASIVIGAAATHSTKGPHSVVPLFHATYKALEREAGSRRDRRSPTFGL